VHAVQPAPARTRARARSRVETTRNAEVASARSGVARAPSAPHLEPRAILACGLTELPPDHGDTTKLGSVGGSEYALRSVGMRCWAKRCSASELGGRPTTFTHHVGAGHGLRTDNGRSACHRGPRLHGQGRGDLLCQLREGLPIAQLCPEPVPAIDSRGGALRRSTRAGWGDAGSCTVTDRYCENANEPFGSRSLASASGQGCASKSCLLAEAMGTRVAKTLGFSRRRQHPCQHR
jgi:hypothetical protein